MCYSSNLRLNDSEEAETHKIESTFIEKMDVFFVYLSDKESAFLENPARLFFSVHSPFVFDNFALYKNEMKPGHQYKIYIRLEEEHLLPYPYFTNCTDYNTLWKANNRKGPRSQQEEL
ncbi:uncharacterized protein TNCT_269601 [Trichonephila clavata]|uniref:Uncharacterized protein n=1 Tax=Trichonephila clavata TaxID=2740835 RepID=A0A8X6IDN0_TRICU|nr:uncharacterized protein TNCT_269601 [Trichonephila clavata]